MKHNYNDLLLNPTNCSLLLIDHEPQMLFGVNSMQPDALLNNLAGLCKTAKLFSIPTIITTITEKSFSGPVFNEISSVFPNQKYIDRTSINSWEDSSFVSAVKATKRKKLILSGLWTEVCVALPALCALQEGYEVYIVTDACGGVSKTAHDNALNRMTQAGAVLVNWLGVLCEMQRDWSRKDTYDGTLQIAKEHAGAYGAGILYAQTMLK